MCRYKKKKLTPKYILCLLQEKNYMTVELSELRYQFEEISASKDMQEVYISQLKAQIMQLEREMEHSAAFSQGTEKVQTSLKDKWV